MRILIAGSSGFLGTRLARALTADRHEVRTLVRRQARTAAESRWEPDRGRVDPGVIAETDAVINLAGANVGGRRWTAEYKRQLRDSRIDTTATLARAMAEADAPPKILLNSSAVGYYGDTADRPVDEQSPAGTGFLADLCRDWEAATAPAQAAGVRVAHLRTGFPLDRDEGFLKPLMFVFRLGIGGTLGSGDQYLPWIALPDWLAAVRFLLEHDVAGPVNLTGPNPVTNAAFTRALGRQLHRPTLLPVPRPALRVALGEFATEALASQRALPGVLTAAGFDFRYQDVTSALRWAVNHGD
ncbi:TIGR01777 family oxidoreductase [Planosporangium sp. 12N6]|uniref:TIGR01777 family oxidoreductase n=1 Tax=Planosporangium spinosum TaxID=3402278 RepID=UPI003CE89B0A